MYNIADNTPRLKSLKQRKWFILIFWFYILFGIALTIFTIYMFFVDAEVFVIMILMTSGVFYRAYKYNCAYNGIDDWENFRNSKIDIDELIEIEAIEDDEERKKRKQELQVRSEEYNRLWEVSWKLKLLNRKEEIYQKKINKKKEKFDKKRKELEQELIPRCNGIKM